MNKFGFAAACDAARLPVARFVLINYGDDGVFAETAICVLRGVRYGRRAILLIFYNGNRKQREA